MSVRRAVVIVCALAGLASSDTPQQRADTLFGEGRELLTVNKDAKAACDKFEAAIQLDASATGTMLNLGLCYEMLGKYARSIYWFRRAQAAAAEAHLAEYEDAAKGHTVTISPKVPSVKLEPSEAGAQIQIDGKLVAPTEYGKTEVDPGEHVIVGTAAGKKKVVEHIDLEEGESRTVALAFNEAAVAVYIDRGEGRRRAAMILGGAGIAAMAFSGVYSYLGKRDWDHASSIQEQDEIAARVRYVGTGGFILGAGALVAGGILYLTAPGKEQVSDGTAFAPTVSKDGMGLAFAGSF